MLFFKQHVDIVNGGYICIHKDNINMYHDMYYNTVKKYLDLGITDDDQYIASMCYVENKDKFEFILNSNWYCLFDEGLSFVSE